jgi:cytochrome c oxidase cbb3-type subunit 3
MSDHTEIDQHSGTATTGHSWDGIKELDTPMPRWWVITFYLTIFWAIGYFIVYPAWPTLSGYTHGVFNYSTRAQLQTDLADLRAVRGEKAAQLATASLIQIESDPSLLAFARALGKTAFGDNCAACHGTGAAGAKGYPNLNDDDWLWGGKLEQIRETIKFGVRSGHKQAHEGSMLAFGRDGILKSDEIVAVANYVRSLSGLPLKQGVILDAGKKLFADNCASCHGDAGKGNQELGAPNLTDKIWLYGADEATLIETIANGRGGVMPTWEGRLDPATINALTVYVHTLGGGK